MTDSPDGIIITDTPPLPAVPHTRRQERRWIVLLLVLALGSTLLLIWLAGNEQTLALLQRANPLFVALIVVVQTLRYMFAALSTRTVARIFGVRVGYGEVFEMTTAAQAANRTFVGGAAGVVIRLAFFLRHGVHSGTFAAIETIEDSVSVVAITLLFLGGLAVVLVSGLGEGMNWQPVAAFLIGVALLAMGAIWLVRRRALVERIANGAALALDRIIARIVRRTFYDEARVRAGVGDFYDALNAARRDPGRVFISFLCAGGRLGSDAAALYLAYHAIGYSIAPGLVLVIFVVSSTVATLAAIPGQIGVMETTLTLLSTSLGVSPPVAVSASLVFRIISFLLPIPIGYLSAWDLRRRGKL